MNWPESSLALTIGWQRHMVCHDESMPRWAPPKPTPTYVLKAMHRRLEGEHSLSHADVSLLDRRCEALGCTGRVSYKCVDRSAGTAGAMHPPCRVRTQRLRSACISPHTSHDLRHEAQIRSMRRSVAQDLRLLKYAVRCGDAHTEALLGPSTPIGVHTFHLEEPV